MSRTVSVNAWVDVDLDDISDDDLIDELESRNLGRRFELNADENPITEMFYAFKLGRDDKAMEIAKKIAQDHTGRIL
jgi:hypothetical protein